MNDIGNSHPEDLGVLLDTRSAEHHDRRVFTFLGEQGETVLTFGDLRGRARAVAHELTSRGFEAGDRALLVYPPGLEFIVGFFGCVLAGLVPVHAPYPTRPLRRVLPRLQAIADDCRPRLALVPREATELVGELCDEAPDFARLPWIYSDAMTEPPAPSWAARRVGPRSLAFIQYTSGSTSTPRGVLVTHRNVLANCDYMGQPPDTRIVSWLPMFHDFGLVYGVFQPIFSAIECVLMAPASFLQRPVRWLEAISRFSATHAPAPNFAYDLCARAVTDEQKRGLSLQSWNVAINAAEPVRKDTIDRFLAAFEVCGLKPTVFLPAYGLAEATLLVSRHEEAQPPCVAHARADALKKALVETERTEIPGTTRALVSSGGFHGDTTVLVVDRESLTPCASGRVGELWVSGPSVAAGYWGRERDTKDVFDARLASGEGPYLRTGDLGFVQDGQVFVTGRSKDLIIVHGRNHYPQDIEATVQACDASLVPNAVAAFSVDADGEERLVVIAEVQTRAARTVDAPAVAETIRARVSSAHELPVHAVVFVPERSVPKTTSGKIQRGVCRIAYTERTLTLLHEDLLPGSALQSGQYAVAERSTSMHAEDRQPARSAVEIEQDVMQLVSRLFRKHDPPRFSPVDVLGTIGVDSIMAAELSAELSSRYGTPVGPSSLFEATARSIAVSLANDVAGSVGDPTTKAASDRADVVPTGRVTRIAPRHVPAARAQGRRMGFGFGLFYFADAAGDRRDWYDLVLDTARASDRFGFDAVWLPERHFHPFGGVCPNPSVLAAAVSQVTSQVRIRAGSVILPLHNPIRVCEEWALVDNLSGGRVDIAFGTGWNANDFVLAPGDYENRRPLTFSRIELVQSLWRGEEISGPNGKGATTSFHVYPRPVQPELPVWLTCTGGAEGFIEAGAYGFNVLTALLFQSVEELATKIALYRSSRARHGHDPDAGLVTLMLHTYVGNHADDVRRTVRAPFLKYLESSVTLWRQKEKALAELSASERAAALDFAFERYYQSAALFGTVESCTATIERVRAAGVGEVACLVDFGVDRRSVLAGVSELDKVRRRFQDERAALVGG